MAQAQIRLHDVDTKEDVALLPLGTVPEIPRMGETLTIHGSGTGDSATYKVTKTPAHYDYTVSQEAGMVVLASVTLSVERADKEPRYALLELQEEQAKHR
jgi:hypothetical protein